MDDDGRSNGLSGWAGIALGRMWAEHGRSMDETAHWFANRNRPVINVAALQADNQALAAENAQLRHSLAEYKINYDELRRWSDGAEETIRQLRRERG